MWYAPGLFTREWHFSDRVPDRPVAFQPPLEHPSKYWHVCINIIENPNLGFPRMRPVEAASVLDQCPSPRDGQGKEQRVEPRVIEPLADIAAGGQDQPLLGGGDRGESPRGIATLLRAHAAMQHDEMAGKPLQLVGEIPEMVLPLREEDRRPPPPLERPVADLRTGGKPNRFRQTRDSSEDTMLQRPGL